VSSSEVPTPDAAAPAPTSRTRIVDAARDAFVDGAGDFEMGDVAGRAGVSNGLAYHYFGSKAGLISALIADFYDRYDAIVNRRYSNDAPWPERERLRLRRSIEFLFGDPMAPILLGRLAGSGPIVAVEAARREAIIALAERNIRRGQERGEIDHGIDAAIAAAVINGGLRQAVAMALARPEPPDAVNFTREAWGLVAGMLALPKS
jgi:AcrR family transcriptional regulator